MSVASSRSEPPEEGILTMPMRVESRFLRCEEGRVRYSSRIGSEPDAVYSLLRDLKIVKRAMSGTVKIEMARVSPTQQISEWGVQVEGLKLEWKQEDYFDDPARLWSFRMVEGACAYFEGRCAVKPLGSFCQVGIEIDFDWGIPRLGRYVGPALEAKVKKAIARFVAVLRKEASSRQVQEP